METVSVTCKGKRYELPALRLSEVIDFGGAADAAAFDTLSRNLEAADIEPEERLRRLNEFSKTEGMCTTLVRYAFSTAGSYQIVSRSLAKQGETVESCKLAPDVLVEWACALLNIELGDAAVGDPDDEEIHGERPTEAAIAAIG